MPDDEMVLARTSLAILRKYVKPRIVILFLPEFDPTRRTIVHCAAGARSALAADTLRQLGYGKVAHLEGGFEAWQATGHSVEGGNTP